MFDWLKRLCLVQAESAILACRSACLQQHNAFNRVNREVGRVELPKCPSDNFATKLSLSTEWAVAMKVCVDIAAQFVRIGIPSFNHSLIRSDALILAHANGLRESMPQAYAKSTDIAKYKHLIRWYIPRDIENDSSRQRGILFTGKLKHFSGIHRSIISLRSMLKVTLPVEIWVNDYNINPCKLMFQKFSSVSCKSLRSNPDKFASKFHALLMTSFSDVLLLDADSIPVRDVNVLFESGMYVFYNMESVGLLITKV
jgi:hypothetical protein